MFIDAVKSSNYLLTEGLILQGFDINTKCMDIIGLTGSGIKVAIEKTLTWIFWRNEKGTALHYAAQKGDTRMVELLLSYGADVDIVTTIYHKTPLHCAAISDSTDVIKVLLIHQADINKTSYYGNTALHYATIWNGIGATELLIKKGIDVNHKCKHIYGWTPLHFAAINGSTECALILLQYGADATVMGIFGLTALHFAEHFNNDDLVDAIIDSFNHSQIKQESKVLPKIEEDRQANHDQIVIFDTSKGDTCQDVTATVESTLHGHSDGPHKKYTQVMALLSEDESEMLLPKPIHDDNQNIATEIAYKSFKHVDDANKVRRRPIILANPRNDSPAITGEPSEIKLKNLARQIGYEWTGIAFELGISYKEQEQIEMNFPLDSKRRVTDMLMRWRAKVQNKTKEERCAILKRALLEENRTDLANSIS